MSEIKYRLAVDPSGLQSQLTGVERMFGSHSASVSRELDAMRLASTRFGTTHVGEAARAIEATDRLASAVGKVGTVTGAVLGGVGLGQVTSVLSGMADELAGMEGRLKLVTNSSREYAKAQEDIAEIAERQRAGLTEIGGLYTKTASVASDLGASQKDVAKFTEAVAASLVLNGTSAQESAGAILQLGQAIGGANLQAEEFNSILDGARPLLAAAAQHIDGAGGSVSKLKELVSEGKVSSKEFFSAVVQASEDLTQSTSKLPLTIGQATTLLRNDALRLVGDFDKMTGASQLVAEAIKGLGTHLDVLAVAGAAVAGVMAGKLLQSLGSSIVAKIADRAVTIELARATVLQTEAAVAQAMAQVGAAQAMNLGVGSATALAAAEVRLMQAQTARAAAQAGLNAATTAGGMAASLATGAVGLLGGPLGIILTLLSAGAAAWAFWGNSSKQAAEVAASLGDKLDESVKRLEREVELLQKRNMLVGSGQKLLAGGSDEDVQSIVSARARLVELEGELAQRRGWNASTLDLENEKYALNFHLGRMKALAEEKERQKAIAEERENGDKRTKWLAQLCDKAVQLQQELKKARADFNGVVPPEVEAAIRKKFAEPVNKAAADMVKAGTKLYGDLAAQGGGLAADFAEKWDSLSAAYRANRISVVQLEQAQRLLLEQQPAIKASMEAEQKSAQAAREEVEKTYLATVKAAEQDAKQAAERLAALQLEEAGLALSARANITLAEAVEQVQIARLQEAATVARNNGEQERLDAINAEIAARQKLAKLAGAKELREQGKEAAESLKQYLGKDIGIDLAAGFDKASQSLGQFVAGVRGLVDVQQAQAQAMRDNLKANGSDWAKFAKVQQQITDKGTTQQLNAYGNIAGAAKGFFKEGTKGYSALQKAEQVFRAFELAMSVKAMAQRLLEVTTVTTAKVTGDQLAAQSSIASAAQQVAANTVAGQSAAVAGVANQAMGDPYSAIPRMAAMAAIMAALGFLVGGFGGGSKADPGNTGTGTVLGDSSAKSASITNAIEHLAKNSDVSLRYSQGMLSALNTIADGISGLSGLIVRDGNLTTGANFGVQEGTKLPGVISNPALAGVLGGAIGVAVSLASKLPVVGKVINSLFGSKTSINATGLYMGNQTLGSIVNDGASLQNYIDVTKKKKAFGYTYSSKSSTQFSSADPLLQQQFGLMFQQFYNGIELAAQPLGANLDEVRKRLSSFVVSIGKIDLKGLTGEQIQEKLTAVFGAAADNIAGAALPGLRDFQKVGEGYFETVVRVASGVESAKSVLDRLGVSAVAYTNIANKQGDVGTEVIRESLLAWEHARYGLTSGVGDIVEAFSGTADELATLWGSLAGMRDGLRAIGVDVRALGVEMIRGAGGVDALNDGLQTYFDKFLTEGERTSEMSRRLSEKFSALGLSMPSSIDGFRQLVKGIDTSTAAGQELFGRVITLSGSFAALQEALAGAAESSSQLAADRLQLENELLQLQGNTAELRRRELAGMDASLRPLQERIWALQDEQAAAQAAAQAQQQLASQRESLEGQLLQLQGNTTELRRRELEKLDAGLRPLQERIYALQDEQAAAQAAAQAQQQLASQREGLESQLLQLTGTTAEIRAAELAKMDASLRPLQERIWAIQDEKAAAEAAAEAATRASEAWERLGDGIEDEINRIRGLLSDSPASSLTTLQAQFAIDTAAARAGDQEAAARLPQLSGSLLEAAEASASSSTELRRLQAATMASLEATLAEFRARQAQQGAVSAAVMAGGAATYDASLIAGGASAAASSNDELLQEVRKLRAEVEQFRAEQEASQFAIASSSQRTAKVLERVSPAGDALVTREAVS